jgi:hypothetical protein
MKYIYTYLIYGSVLDYYHDTVKNVYNADDV